MEINISQLLWLFIFVSAFLIPSLRMQQINAGRVSNIQNIQKKRNSRVITLIHRQESIGFLGIPLTRYINIEDSEQLLRAIRLTPDDVPIDLVLHTPGGLVLASEQIARAIQSHPAKVTVHIPHFAMSGGTMIALAADEIIMDENAVLGPVDPQLGQYPAVSIVNVLKKKDINEVDDETIILADIAAKALVQVRELLKELLLKNYPEEKAEEIAELLSGGKWTHDYPITCNQLKDMGLKVSRKMLKEVYVLMELYPQPPQRRPSVQYIPYERTEEHKNKR
jgi:ClpP class serine protease